MSQSIPLERFWSLGQWEKTQSAPWVGRWILSCPVGDGIIYRYTLSSGMDLYLTRYTFFEPVRLALTADQSLIGFYFCLAGQGRIHETDSEAVFVQIRGDNGFYARPAGSHGVLEVPGGKEVILVSVSVPMDRFDRLAGTCCMETPKVLSRIMDTGRKQFAFASFKGTPRIRAVVDQILNHSFADSLDYRLFMEAKAWEIMACIIDQARKGSGTRSPRISLCRDDLDRLHHVRDILKANMEAPPCLSELASQAGMNHFKLNQAFKQEFGGTVFRVLREIRLETARDLLLSGQMNVTQASFHVGYSSLSHFAKAFRTQYGISPGDCMTRAF